MVVASNSRPLSDRAAERAVLRELAASDRSEFLAVYGRRRIGKTFLVRRFFQDQPVAYFEVVGKYQGTLREHLGVFAQALSATYHSGAKLAPPVSWSDAFVMLASAIEAQGRRKRRKHVLFFDELPWMATHRSGVLGALEHFWNAWCSKRDDIVLIVCGSAASWMLRNVVHAKGGLHNRLTRTIRLLPFTLGETKTFFTDRRLSLTPRDALELYMIFGGVAHYLDQVGRGLSVAQIVDRLCFDKDGTLAGELDRLFASLFDSDPKHLAVVRALAKKRRGLTRNELLDLVALPSGGGATTVLENLEEGGFVSSSIPFGRQARDRFFRLTDQFALFYLTWMEGRAHKSWQLARKSPRWRAWAGLAFESVCLENVGLIERALGISGVETHPSSWLHAGAQIDLLIDRADGVISVCEIKFTDEPFVITKKYAAELRQKLAVFRAQTGTKKAVQLVFIAASGLVANAHAREIVDRVLTLDDLLPP